MPEKEDAIKAKLKRRRKTTKKRTVVDSAARNAASWKDT